MGKASRRLLLAAGAIGIVAFLLTTGTLAQVIGVDPRNESPEYWDAVNDGQCFEHHLEDGFNPFTISFVQAYSQIPRDQDVDLQVRIRHDTKYLGPHTVEEMAVTINTEDAPNIIVITDDLQEDIEESWQASGGHGTQVREQAFIGSGAVSGQLSARITNMDPDLRDADQPGTFDFNAAGKTGSFEGPEAAMELDREFFRSRGIDNYTFQVTWNSPFTQLSTLTVDIEVTLTVLFGQEQTEFTFPSEKAVLRTADPPESTVVTIPIRIDQNAENPDEEGLLDFRVKAIAFWEHQPGDGAPRDDGLYYRFLTMPIKGGDDFIEARSFAPAPVEESVNLYNMLTRLLGFIAFFLIVAAMFSGGVFGKSSRRFMNKFTGGAKKRVLWHSAMGFLIIVVATVHFGLALIETKQDLSKGMLWGGLAWMLLITLGFTGYYQVRMIKKWSYRSWRHVHLWSAVAVLLFVVMHTLLEGADLRAVREVLPSWHEKLIWPRAPGG